MAYYTDDGDTWDLLIEGMAENNREISALAWDPRNPDRMYAGSLGDFTECRVYVTEDALGDCLWQQAYVENSFDVDITDLRTSPFDPDVVYASTGDFYNALGYPHDFLGILKSTNGGVTWSSANTGILAKDLRAVEVDPLDPSIVYAGGWGAFYKSTSTGQQWTDHTKGFLWMAGGLLALRGEELHACSPHLFTRSKNSGGTWQVTQFNDRILRTTSMALNPLDPKDVLSGGNAILGVDEYATLWRSTNGGDSWTVWAFPGNPTGTITALAHDKAVPGRVYATFSGGAQWSPAEVRRSDDHGATWSTLLRLDDPAFLPTLTTMSIKPGAGGQPASTIYVAGSLGGGPQVIKTTDGGLTWTNVSTGLPSTPVSSLQMDLSNPEVLYVGTSGHGVYKSVNGGQSWSESGSGLTYLNITGLLANPRNPGHLFALARESNTDYCLRTTNGGASWTAFSGGLPLIPSLAYGKLAIDPVEPYRIFVTTPVGVYSADAPPFQPTGLAWYGEPGQHPTFAWTANTEPDLAGYHIFRDGTRLNASLITTNTYIDSSITVPQNGGGVVHFYTVSAVDNASNESARSPHATFEEGLQQGERPISGGEAENRRPSESIHPRAPFGLSQNYPNPFNPSTIISYSLETDGWAELSVFDILGREVQNLVHGLTKAGRHQVVFDAAHLAPGLYFCRLQNSGSTAVQKMLLVK